MLIPRIFSFREPDRSELDLVEATADDYVESVDIPVQTHGAYKTPSGLPKGLVVHFTAGRSEKGRQDAINSMQGLANRGLGCMFMDNDGVIYKSSTQGWGVVAYHAGRSEWLGKTGISQYCMGMEVCNAGKLKEVGGEYFPWWSFDLSGELLSSAESIPAEKVVSAGNNQNIHAGYYMKFTEKQIKSLTHFVQWQLSVNPEFDLDWVVGHDEIAPTRKDDPGGSLTMSMPEFRMNQKLTINHT